MKFFKVGMGRALLLIVSGILITLLVQNSPLLPILTKIIKDNIEVIAVIGSPLIALLAGDKMAKKSAKEREEYEVLRNLVSFRHEQISPEFLSALNRVILIFNKDEDIKQAVRELHRAYSNKENSTVITQRQVELINEICKYKGYDVSEFDIFNCFVPDKPQAFVPAPTIQVFQQVQPTPIVQQPPTSTGNASFTNDCFQSLITSGSLAANNFCVKSDETITGGEVG